MKKKTGYISIPLAIILLMVIIGAIALFFGTKQTQSPETANITPTIDAIPPTIAAGAQPSQAPDAIPQANNVYLATYQGKDALFLVDAKLSKQHAAGEIKVSPLTGQLQITDETSQQPFDYKLLQNPRRVFNDTTGTITGIGEPRLNNEKTFLYFAAIFPASSQNITTKVFQINLNNLESEQLWTGDTGSDKYQQTGSAEISLVVEDKYLVLQIGSCYACEGADPVGVVIINIATTKEKYLGSVGGLQFDLKSYTVSYKKLAPVTESCQSEPGCVNGRKTVYKPSGQLITESLL